MDLLTRAKGWGKAVLATHAIVLLCCLIGRLLGVARDVGAFDDHMWARWRKLIWIDLIFFAAVITLYILVAYVILNLIRRTALRLSKNDDSRQGVLLISGVAAAPPILILLLPFLLLLPPSSQYPYDWALSVLALAMIVGAFLAIWRLTRRNASQA